MENFAKCLTKGQPPWVAYWDLVSGRLIALDKQPGIRPVGVGENWRPLMAKYVPWVTGDVAKVELRTEQLVGGVNLALKGGNMLCASYGNSTPRRITGVFFSLMHGTP